MNAELTDPLHLAIARIYTLQAALAGECIIHYRSLFSAALFNAEYHFSSSITINIPASSFLDSFNLAIVMFKIASSVI